MTAALGSSAASNIRLAQYTSPGDSQWGAPPSYQDSQYNNAFWTLRSSAPRAWSDSNVHTVARATVQANRDLSTAMDVVNGVNSTTVWSAPEDAYIAATALLAGNNRWGTVSVINSVVGATPYGWSNQSDIRLTAAALRSRTDAYQAANLISSARSQMGYYAAESQVVARAEQMMYSGNNIPYYDPSYPTVPWDGGRYPSPGYPDPGYPNTSPGDSRPSYPYPGYPDPSYPSTSPGDSRPSYPNPDYPSTSPGDSRPSYPNPSYPSTSPGDSGYPSSGYPDTSRGDSSYPSSPSSGTSRGDSYPSSSSSGTSSGDDYPDVP